VVIVVGDSWLIPPDFFENQPEIEFEDTSQNFTNDCGDSCKL
jgi:hypothetical protein